MKTKVIMFLVITAVLIVSGCAGQIKEKDKPASFDTNFPSGWRTFKIVNDNLSDMGATGTTTWYKRGMETLVVSQARFNDESDAKKYYNQQFTTASGIVGTFDAGDSAFIEYAYLDGSERLSAYGYHGRVKTNTLYKNVPDETYRSRNIAQEKELLKNVVRYMLASK